MNLRSSWKTLDIVVTHLYAAHLQQFWQHFGTDFSHVQIFGVNLPVSVTIHLVEAAETPTDPHYHDEYSGL